MYMLNWLVIITIFLVISVLINAILMLRHYDDKDIIRDQSHKIDELYSEKNPTLDDDYRHLAYHPLITWLRHHPDISIDDIEIKESHDEK